MASFSPTDAAFEGFRLTREQPRAVLIWCGAFLVFSLGLSVLSLVWIGPELPILLQLNQTPVQNQDTQEMARVFAKLLPFLLVVGPIEAVFYAVLNSAIYRAILRPQERAFAFFRLGGDEARMVLVAVAYFLLWLAAVFVVSIVVSIAAAISAIFGAPIAAFVALAAGLAAFATAIWVFVRLSLAGPMTFQTRRFTLFESWPLTRGRSAPLLGAYVMAFLFGVIVLLLAWIISLVLGDLSILVTGGRLENLWQPPDPQMNTVRDLLTPSALVREICSAVMTT
ncbi:MAG TPA: hypothetical protein VJP88_08475, partial [Caulobacteraceae bacterium]|nr:hypothetical protein [Caulobacteraceae bacterium]